MSALESQITELLDIRSRIKALREKESDLTQLIAENMETSTVLIPDLGMVTRREKAQRKEWDSAGLVNKLETLLPEVPRLLHPLTGEVETEGALALRVFNTAARPEWRTTGLKAFGIDPDEWCSKTVNGYSIDVKVGVQG